MDETASYPSIEKKDISMCVEFQGQNPEGAMASFSSFFSFLPFMFVCVIVFRIVDHLYTINH